MTTIEKRIAVTPTIRTARILNEYTAITGKPRARLISELLDESTPILEEMLTHIKQAQKTPNLATESLTRYIQSANQQLTAIQKQLPLGKKRVGRKPKARDK